MRIDLEVILEYEQAQEDAHTFSELGKSGPQSGSTLTNMETEDNGPDAPGPEEPSNRGPGTLSFLEFVQRTRTSEAVDAYLNAYPRPMMNE